MYATAIRSGGRLRRARPAPAWRVFARRVAMGIGVFLFAVFTMAQAVHGSAAGGYRTVTVRQGDTVWSIASERYPGVDTREKVQEILAANGMSGPQVYPGQELKVPSS